MAEFSLVRTQMRRIWDYSMGFMLDKQSNVGKMRKNDDELADHNRIQHNTTAPKTERKARWKRKQKQNEFN